MRYSFIKDIDHNHQPHTPLLVTDHLYLEKINKDHSDDWFMAMTNSASNDNIASLSIMKKVV